MRCEFLQLNYMLGAASIASLCVNVVSCGSEEEEEVCFAKHMCKKIHMVTLNVLLWLKLIPLVQILGACKFHLHYPHKISAQSKNYCVPCVGLARHTACNNIFQPKNLAYQVIHLKLLLQSLPSCQVQIKIQTSKYSRRVRC